MYEEQRFFYILRTFMHKDEQCLRKIFLELVDMKKKIDNSS